MAHTKTWTPALSLGEQIFPSKLSDLNDALALTIREGSNTLASDVDVDLAAKDFTANATGAGRFVFRSQYPAVGNITATDYHPAAVAHYDATDWTSATTGSWPGPIGLWSCTEVVAYSPIDFVVTLPPGLAITSVKAVVLGESSGAPGGTMPAISFFYTTPAAPGTANAIGNQDDGATTEVAFEAVHNITLSVSHTTVAGRIYHVAVRNGYGGNHTSLKLYAVTITADVGELRVLLWQSKTYSQRLPLVRRA